MVNKRQSGFVSKSSLQGVEPRWIGPDVKWDMSWRKMSYAWAWYGVRRWTDNLGGKKECVKSQKEEEEVAARGVAGPSWLGWVLGGGNWSRRQSVLGMLAIARPSVRRHHTRAHHTMLQAFLVNSHSSVFNTFQPISALSEPTAQQMILPRSLLNPISWVEDL